MIYDVIIIGSGPAGLSAAIYAQRAELTNLVIEKTGMSGGQIINTYEVDNYPGTPGISGFDLSTKFREHCDKLGTTFITGEVVKFNIENDIKVITLDEGTYTKPKQLLLHREDYLVIWKFRERISSQDWDYLIVQPVMELFSRKRS